MTAIYRRFYVGNPDSFKLVFEYGKDSLVEQAPALQGGQVRLPVALATLEFEFNSDESEATVLERFTQAKSRIAFDRLEERVVLKLVPSHDPAKAFRARLSIACISPALRCVQVLRTSGTGTAPEALLTALFKHCDLSGVWKLRGAEGFGNFWCSCCEVRSWRSLANLNLSSSGLAALPPALGALGSLRLLRLSHNKLTALPPEVSALTALEVLAADHNMLTAIPAELRRCSSLRHLELEGNRLVTPVLDLRALSNLVSLQLYGNPLEYLPELSPALALRSLSLANVRIMADAAYSRWEVEVAALPYMSRSAHKLAPLFKLTFRRSSCQHPLLAGALGRISEDRAHCELMAREETAIQQLVLMALSEQPVVAEQACRTLGALAGLGLPTARRLLAHDVVSTILTLLRSPRRASKLCGLGLLGSLAAASETVSTELLTPELLQLLCACITGDDPEPRSAALIALAALAFCPANKLRIRAAAGLLAAVIRLSQSPAHPPPPHHPHPHLHPHHPRHSSSQGDITRYDSTPIREYLPQRHASHGQLQVQPQHQHQQQHQYNPQHQHHQHHPQHQHHQHQVVSLGLPASAGATPGAGAGPAGAPGASGVGASGGQVGSGSSPTSALKAGAATNPPPPPSQSHSSLALHHDPRRQTDGGSPAARAPAVPSHTGQCTAPGAVSSPRPITGVVVRMLAPPGSMRHSDTGGGPSLAQVGSPPPAGSSPPPHYSSAVRATTATPPPGGVSSGGGIGGGVGGAGPRQTASAIPITASTTPSSTQRSSGSGGGAASSDVLSPPQPPQPPHPRPHRSMHHSASTSSAAGSTVGPQLTPGTAASTIPVPLLASTTAAAAARTLSPGRPPGISPAAISTGGSLTNPGLMSPTSPPPGGAAEGAAAAAASGLPPQIALAAPRAVPEPVASQDQARLMAIKVLAILGENEHVGRALGQPPIAGRGVRVLALDGGGMRGLALVQMMRHIERRAGRPLYELFDLIVGTSTGAIVAFGLGVFHFTLEQCEAIYTGLGHKVFNQAASKPGGPATSPREELLAAAQAQAAAQAAGSAGPAAAGGWRDQLFRVMRGTSTNLRVAVYGFKHDASTFEELLKQMCDVKQLGCVGNQLIDAAALGAPKVAAVATLVSCCPVTPFLFTSYELPPEVAPAAAAMRACPSSSRHQLWQAVRASSAAPYYLDDFVCGDERYQDGAATANNPSILALQQARLLWPGLQLDTLVSLGCGAAPPTRRERGAHAVLDSGAVLVDAATSPDRADEALSTLLPLVPGVRYFRFQPVHERCSMELDDVNPQHWAALQAAVDEYCCAHTTRFDELAALLLSGREHEGEQGEGADGGGEGSEDDGEEGEEESGFEAVEGLGPDGELLPPVPRVRLGPRRGVVIVEAPCPVNPTAHPPGLPTPTSSTTFIHTATSPHPGCSGSALERAVVAALAALPTTLRRCDLAATAADAEHSAALVAEHMRRLEEREQQRERGEAGTGVAAAAAAVGGEAAPAAGPAGKAAAAATASPPKEAGAGAALVATISEANTVLLTGGVEKGRAMDVGIVSGEVVEAVGGGVRGAPPCAGIPSPSTNSLRLRTAGPSGRVGAAGAGTAGLADGEEVAAAADTACVADAAVEAAAAGSAPSTASSLYEYFFGSTSSTTAAAAAAVHRSASERSASLSGRAGVGSQVAPAPATPAQQHPHQEQPGAAQQMTRGGPEGPSAAPARSEGPSLSLPMRSGGPSSAGGSSAAATPPPAHGGQVVSSPSNGPVAVGVTSGAAAAPGGEGVAAGRAGGVGGGDGGAAAAEGEDGDGDVPVVQPAALLGALLEDFRGQCGLLHLSLSGVCEAASSGNSGGGAEESDCGLVASWRQEVVAVVEPGPDADRLLRELGHTPGSASCPRLSGLFAAARGAPLHSPRCATLTLLARQEVWHRGTPLATLLLQVSRPALLLRPSDLASMAPQLSGLVVTATAALPPPLTMALLQAGAAAVVCPEQPLLPGVATGSSSDEVKGEEVEEYAPGRVRAPGACSGRVAVSATEHASSSIGGGLEDRMGEGGLRLGAGGMGMGESAADEDAVAAVSGFFAGLVSEMVGGATVLGAIVAAEERHPELRGRLVFHHL